MNTDYRNQWPGMQNSPDLNVSPEMRIGQLKHDLRQSQTTVRILEWLVLIEFVVIVVLAMICVS